jgi:predicted metal-dependent hydrolase
MLCPDEIRDYVVVHELSHQKELNHSPRFWAQVEVLLPDYKQRRSWLKNNGGAIIGRLR